MTDCRVTRIVVDLRTNQLTLELEPPLPRSGGMTASADIGALGRLIGIEVSDAGADSNHYLAIADPAPGSEAHVRTAEVTVNVVDHGRRLVVPRRGPDWEISFPSGNQCWTRAGGAGSLCSVLAGAG